MAPSPVDEPALLAKLASIRSGQRSYLQDHLSEMSPTLPWQVVVTLTSDTPEALRAVEASPPPPLRVVNPLTHLAPHDGSISPGLLEDPRAINAALGRPPLTDIRVLGMRPGWQLGLGFDLAHPVLQSFDERWDSLVQAARFLPESVSCTGAALLDPDDEDGIDDDAAL